MGSDLETATLRLDFRNNLVYNWGFYAGYSGDTTEHVEMNYIGNYLIAGPSTTRLSAFNGGGVTTKIYQSGNAIDLNKNGVMDAVNTGWTMFTGTYAQTNAAFVVPSMPTESAAVACQRVIALSGAMPWRRDAIDRRIAASIRNQSGQHIDFISSTSFAGDYTTTNVSGTNYIGVNPWPSLAATTAPTDSDNDGMPNYWELAIGSNPAFSIDRNVTNALTGYTRLEEYLSWLADPHALCDRNGMVDVDLREAVGGATNLAYQVNAASIGSVSLLADGHTARFTAAPGTNGVAGFTFTATDPATTVSFGPLNYGILITTTNAPVLNTAPVLSEISTQTIGELALFTLTNAATDPDLPLSYALLDAPEGAAINGNGVITWIPTEAQGPSTNTFTTQVTDSGTPALSATNSFTVIVNEVNSAPTLNPVANASLVAGATLVVTNTTTDSDVPAQALTYSLQESPPGAAVNPATGRFDWRPPIASAGSSNYVRVVVTDSGSPSLSATQAFGILVTPPANPVLGQLTPQGAGLLFQVSGDSGPDYIIEASTNLSDWIQVFSTNSPALPFNWIDPDATSIDKRFYRVLLGP